jgi:cytochrome c
MDFLSHYIIAPSGQHLKLLEFLAIVTYAIHLPYVALVMGSTGVALWLTFSDHEIPNARFARLAEDLLRTFLGRRLTMLVLGVLPLLALPFLYGQWFDGVPMAPIVYIVLPIPGILMGFVLLWMYRTSFAGRKNAFNQHMGLGTLGLLALMGSYFVLLSAVIRLQDPEKWFRLKNLAILLLNWNVIYKYLFFVHAAFAITGAGMLFFLFRWSDRSTTGDPEYAAFVRKFGAGLGLAFCFALPVFNLLYVFTSPDVALDNTVYLMAAASVFVCMLAAYMFVGFLRAPHPHHPSAAFIMLLVVFVLSSAFDVRAMANANREHAFLLQKASEKETMERDAKIDQAIASASGANVGEETFNKVCSQCHKFNEKLVGPALASVLPKYAGDVAKLKAFLANPTKINPDFPPMPNPGLTSAQIDAVAPYVLEQLKTETGGGTEPAPATDPAAPTTQPEVQSGTQSH